MDSDDEGHAVEAEVRLGVTGTVPTPPPEKKQRRKKLSEAERLSGLGTMSRAELHRTSIQITPSHAQITVVDSQSAAAEPSPRPRPDPEAYAVPGVIAPHTRPKSSGLLHWSNYGNLPKAKITVVEGEQVKVFEWRGLFQEINSRKVFTEQEDGPDLLEMSESKLDFWDSLRNHWLQKRYGKPVEATARRESFLRKKRTCFP